MVQKYLIMYMYIHIRDHTFSTSSGKQMKKLSLMTSQPVGKMSLCLCISTTYMYLLCVGTKPLAFMIVFKRCKNYATGPLLQLGVGRLCMCMCLHYISVHTCIMCMK